MIAVLILYLYDKISQLYILCECRKYRGKDKGKLLKQGI